jgi:putative aminopeptidase FrvX
MNIEIDLDRVVQFLVELLEIPSPTGDTERAIDHIATEFEIFPFSSISISEKGFLVATLEGEAESHPRALTAHVDTLGAMVSHVRDNGRLRLTQLGGWAWNSVEGEGVTIFASNGEQYRGTILPDAASSHAYTRDEITAKRTEKNVEVRIDARTRSADETRALGIRVGDVVAFDPRVELSSHGFIRSRHLDDKAGVAAIFGALSAIHEAGLVPRQRTTIHISNYEEVGHGAAAGFPPDLAELIAVDMAVVAPKQSSSEFAVTICAKDAAGPYHLGLRRHLEQLADQMGIRYETDIFPYYSSDGEAYWRSGGEVAVALVGPGVDASHHYERTHREALESTSRLLVAYLLS